jgi:mRNA interferase RelE/StbE
MKTKPELVFTKEFLRRLEQLDKKTQIRVLKKLRTLEEKPFIGKRLTGHLTGLLSLRIGNYRIIYQISENKIIIRTVGHRKTIYKR